MSKPAPKSKPDDRAEYLRAAISGARRQAEVYESEADDYERELTELEKKRKEEERRRKYGEGKSDLANYLAREVTGGDISWLSYEEQERWRRIADLAADFCEDRAAEAKS